MPSYFLDTSVLNKRYHVEVGTADVDAIFANPKAQIYAAGGYASIMVNYRGSTGYGRSEEHTSELQSQ